jgi:hypothetical protein
MPDRLSGYGFSDPQTLMSLRECQKPIEDATGKVPSSIRVSLGLAGCRQAKCYSFRPPTRQIKGAIE